jgi:hypothetical protein
LYRKQMVWGIAAWLATPTSMYDELRLDALVRRCVAAAEDLETYSLKQCVATSYGGGSDAVCVSKSNRPVRSATGFSGPFRDASP